MPEIEDLKINLTQYKVSDGNSTTGHDTESIDDNQSVTSQSGKQNTLARDFFEKEETGEDLLYPTLPSILAPSNRISHLHEDTDFNSPLVANWREQFATKKQVLTQMLNAQLDELEAERSIALKSKKLMSKAYKGALKDAHLATHDLTPKTFMIWQKAREDVLEESPDSEERIAFLKELDKQRKRLKKARLESHIMRDAFLTVKMYVEELQPIDETLLHFLVARYGKHIQSNREVYNFLNHIRARLKIDWQDFMQMIAYYSHTKTAPKSDLKLPALKG
eukprot:TRINITY_DN1566_c0_g1_i9.p1 TRINITY_DN1566_c0_g1~~TRINITY_DN1566_c0_g1_i9.p1  ORF type:complete len:278 (+),score=73.02 TRINITY_DN1566_c0_g1_i9:912-1745(+)